MTRAEIINQAENKLQIARENFTGEGVDCGTPFLLAKYQIEKERDELLQKYGHTPCNEFESWGNPTYQPPPDHQNKDDICDLF